MTCGPELHEEYWACFFVFSTMTWNEQKGGEQEGKDQKESREKGGKIDAVQVQCSSFNNGADTGGQEGTNPASAERNIW